MIVCLSVTSWFLSERLISQANNVQFFDATYIGEIPVGSSTMGQQMKDPRERRRRDRTLRMSEENEGRLSLIHI